MTSLTAPFYWRPLIGYLGIGAVLLVCSPSFGAEKGGLVEFNRDVRPILSDNCFQCHGPDKNKRKAGLRLDTEEGAFAKNVLVPGDPAKSELLKRLTHEDESKRMPPAKSARKPTPEQIDLVRRWIEQGAKWQKHWAFIPPQRPASPAVKDGRWPRNPIDHFVLARVEREGLAPSSEADKVTLLRRVTLDLTGLPPTPEDVDAFVNDGSPNAYEKAVDRLLASPRYGERMAMRWLEAARYADTNGYQSDGERIMWRWRDWVIDALNANMPFDRFTVEQLAGDLLPNARLEQRIATGFNRNHRGNGEGGVIPEEYAVEYVADRVETTATVWLGLTLGCARCHDHKFDPVAQKEFYQLFAFFNNVPENGKAIKYGNSPPLIKSPTPRHQEQLRELDARLKVAEERWSAFEAKLDWAAEVMAKSTRTNQWSPSNGLRAAFSLDRAQDKNHFRDGVPATNAGIRHRAGYLDIEEGPFDGRLFYDAGDVGKFGFYGKFSLSALMVPRTVETGTILSRMKDEPQGEGYAVALKDGRIQVNLVKRWLDDALRVETEAKLTPEQNYHVAVTYDGSRVASGIRVFVNGKPQKLRVVLDELNQTFETEEPFRIGAGNGPESRFRGQLGDVRIYDRVLSGDEVEVLSALKPINKIAVTAPEQRTPREAKKLRLWFLETAPPDEYKEVSALRRQREELVESFPTTMVMEEMPTPRDTFVLQRGAYDKPGEKVGPGTPAALSPCPNGARPDRLSLARWLVAGDNPLTARVAVNRAWQTFFGAGLVRTLDDFGSQGEPPTHPELLDWLATEFVRTGWDVKALHRTIVTSATYRQSSRWTKDLLQRDADNRLLARGPRLRLSAEMIRDQALAASGLLVERLGGPSVKPYQPAGLIKELTGGDDYKQDHGPDLYRRGLYTFWKRTVAPPTLTTFDAALRETCVVRQTRTNTPLQALTLMNDVTFVEAARVLAQRVMREAATPEERLTRAFLLITGRPPKPSELKVLAGGLQRQLEEYRNDPDAARKLIKAGESPLDGSLNVGELAAYTALASLLLNLDETIVRE